MTIEERVRTIWSEVLHLSTAEPNGDFFALGGDSFDAEMLGFRVAKSFGIDLDYLTVRNHPTLTALTQFVASKVAAGAIVKDVSGLAKAPTTSVPAIPMQNLLSFFDQTLPGLMNVGGAYSLSGPIHREALQRSVDAMIERHHALRTSFAMEDLGLAQTVYHPVSSPIADVDLQSVPAAERDRRRDEAIIDALNYPFDCSAQTSLVRVALIRLAPEEHILVFTMPHLISEGYSAGQVFPRDFFAFYDAFSSNRDPALPAIKVQFVDYSVEHCERLERAVSGTGPESERFREDTEYLRRVLQPELAPVLPAITQRGERSLTLVDTEYKHDWSPFGEELSREFSNFAKQERVGINALMLAVVGIFLHQSTKKKEVSITLTNIDRPGLELLKNGPIGCFVDSRILAYDYSKNPTVREFVKWVGDTIAAELSIKRIPILTTLPAIAGDLEGGANPPCFTVSLMEVADFESKVGGLTVEPLSSFAPLRAQTSALEAFCLFRYNRARTNFTVYMMYRNELFGDDFGKETCDRYRAIIRGMIKDPEARISDVG